MKPLVVGNWKLHMTLQESVALAQAVARSAPDVHARIGIAPVFTALATVRDALGPSNPLDLVAQNAHYEDSGAFTGEVSVPQLQDVGCRFVIVGHSERRHVFGETDQVVGKKFRAVVQHGLVPILCVGETLEQREAGETETVVLRQLASALADQEQPPPSGLVVAYEPVWAIGTGKTAQPQDAQAVHETIRSSLEARYGESGRGFPILYGGSVKPDNAGALLAAKDIDGALVGGASLTAESFVAIVRAAGR